jgi:hypothetical protein
VKRPVRDADHSPPSRAEVKNAWSYTSAPLFIFVEWYLVKSRDNFTRIAKIETKDAMHRAVWCSGNVLDRCSGGTQFESRLR